MKIKELQFGQSLCIKGIGSGSGLIYEYPYLFIISDDSLVLYKYHIEKHLLRKISLAPDGAFTEGIPKSEKPDFEAITKYQNRFYIFGSGSGVHRFRSAVYDPSQDTVSDHPDLNPLYRQMMKSTGLQEEDFNIEGVILQEDSALFFNRGNGPKNKNGLIKVEERTSTRPGRIRYIPVELPYTDGIPFTFTDALLADRHIYFLATTEATTSTYEDGEVSGSALGILSRSDFQLTDFRFITADYKLEGITLYEKTAHQISFLACEDADDGILETKIFQLSIQPSL